MSEMFPSPISLDIQDLPAIPTPDRDELAPYNENSLSDAPLDYKRVEASHGRLIHILDASTSTPIKVIQFNGMDGALLLLQNKIVPLRDILVIRRCKRKGNGVLCITVGCVKMFFSGLTPSHIVTLMIALEDQKVAAYGRD